MKLTPGTRVRYTSSHSRKQYEFASTGLNNLYVHIGASESLTGVILRETPLYKNRVAFRPDGWPLVEGMRTLGFMVPVKDLEIIGPDVPESRCVLTNGVGVPYPPAEIERLVNEYLSRKG